MPSITLTRTNGLCQLASPMELPQTQRWALLHSTRSTGAALAQTAVEHNEMLGTAQRRAKQHLAKPGLVD